MFEHAVTITSCKQTGRFLRQLQKSQMRCSAIWYACVIIILGIVPACVGTPLSVLTQLINPPPPRSFSSVALCNFKKTTKKDSLPVPPKMKSVAFKWQNWVMQVNAFGKFLIIFTCTTEFQCKCSWFERNNWCAKDVMTSERVQQNVPTSIRK